MPVWWPMSGLDLIPDAETALKVGTAILDEYYGESFVRKYEPYRAIPDPHGEDWWVLGSRGNGSTEGFGGGFSEISIAKKDARVTRIALSK